MGIYKLQTVNNNGNIINESELLLKENSVLIVKPIVTIRIDTLMNIHNYITKALNEGDKVITIPNYIDLQILNIEN